MALREGLLRFSSQKEFMGRAVCVVPYMTIHKHHGIVTVLVSPSDDDYWTLPSASTK
jgi:hypothetical protein